MLNGRIAADKHQRGLSNGCMLRPPVAKRWVRAVHGHDVDQGNATAAMPAGSMARTGAQLHRRWPGHDDLQGPCRHRHGDFSPAVAGVTPPTGPAIAQLLRNGKPNASAWARW